MSRQIVAFGLAITAAIVLAARAGGAEPSAATLKQGTPHAVTWNGGPFAAANPAGCAGSVDPTCDHFYLWVDANLERRLIAVEIAGANQDDNYDLFVFAPDGAMVAQSTSASRNERVVFEHRAQAGDRPYEVRVQPTALARGDSTYSAVATAASNIAVDTEAEECSELVPDGGSASSLLQDDGSPIELRLALLLDGIAEERGLQVIEQANLSYAPLNVRMIPAIVRTVALAGTDSQDLLEQAKALYRGARPNNTDLVYVLTGKNIRARGQNGVVGQADCIGGVRFPHRAFAVGEDITVTFTSPPVPDDGVPFGPFVVAPRLTAKIAAHEIGHLLGAHHHYGNCAEPARHLLGSPAPVTPCTQMFNDVTLEAPRFSSVNRAIVRGHAWSYARP